MVKSDHQALSFLFSCKLKSARLTRWTLFIQEFDIRIEYISGIENKVADTLSRHVIKETEKIKPCTDDFKQLATLKFEKTFNLKKHLNQLRNDQEKEEWINNIVTVLRSQQEVGDQKISRIKKWYLVHEGLLFRRGEQPDSCFRLCVPHKQIIELINWQHDRLGHFGKTKTFQYMKEFFYWPKMSKHVRQVVGACEICQKAKGASTSHGLMHSVIPERPGELVCIDMIRPLPSSRGGVTQMLVLVDAFSKYVKIFF